MQLPTLIFWVLRMDIAKEIEQKESEIREVDSLLRDAVRRMKENPEWQKAKQEYDEACRERDKLDSERLSIEREKISIYTTDGHTPNYYRGTVGIETNVREKVLECLKDEAGSLYKLSAGDIEWFVRKLIDKELAQSKALQLIIAKIREREVLMSQAISRQVSLEPTELKDLERRDHELRKQIINLKEMERNPRKAKIRQTREELKGKILSDETVNKVFTKLKSLRKNKYEAKS